MGEGAMIADPLPFTPNRRCFLIRTAGFAAAAGIASTLPLRAGRASPRAMEEAIRGIVGEAALRQGKVALDVPPLVENGNTVPLTVSADSPMTEADHVKAIHIVNERNPQPHVISVVLGPRAGQASLSTRIKLVTSQQIVALAEMSDGSFWSQSADIVVTIAACVEDIP
jgi:sulfur-oxidizing protein SoxY